MTSPTAARLARTTVTLATSALAISCMSGKPRADSSAATTTQTTTTMSRTDSSAASTAADTSWRTLVDSTSTDAWRGYRTQTFPSGWHLAGGALTKSGSVEDLISRDQFGDFELTWDWKVAPGGNAGVFYRATEEYDKVYWSGPEYQLLDDARHPDGKSRLTSAGAAYGIYPSPAGIVKPANEWNSSRIIARGAHIEHWLNGKKVVEYELWSPDWEAKVKASKFSAYPDYGRAKTGHIALQGDHDGSLWIRNMRIRGLR
jgi:3-keto-disaccharide hydrolase